MRQLRVRSHCHSLIALEGLWVFLVSRSQTPDPEPGPSRTLAPATERDALQASLSLLDRRLWGAASPPEQRADVPQPRAQAHSTPGDRLRGYKAFASNGFTSANRTPTI